MRGGWQGLAPGSCCADGKLSVLSDRFIHGAFSPAPPRPAAPAGGSGVAEGRMGFSPFQRTESFLGIDKLSILWYIFCRKAAAAPARGPPNHLGVRGSGGKPLDRRSGGFFCAPCKILHGAKSQDRFSGSQPDSGPHGPKIRRVNNPKKVNRPFPIEMGAPLLAKEIPDTKLSGWLTTLIPRRTQQNLCHFVAFAYLTASSFHKL